MATINSRETIDRLIAGNGIYDSEEPEVPVTKIVEYTNAWGGQCYGVVFEGEPAQDRYEQPTGFVRNPRVIWRRKGT